MPPKPVILAFDTAAAHCAAVVVQGGDVLASKVESMAKGQAERLFPLIEEVLASAGKSMADLDVIAVGTGPGNFTGIRISVSAARGLALSLGIPSIGVSRPDAIAFGLQGTATAVIDARQNRLYVQDFQDGAQMSDIRIVPVDEFASNAPVFCDNEVSVKAKQLPTETALINAAKIAARRLGSNQPRPAPMYVRAPDAALPSDPPPTILP